MGWELKNIEEIQRPSDIQDYVRETLLYILEEPLIASWPEIKEEINNTILQRGPLRHVSPLQDKNHWRKIAYGEVNTSKRPAWWKELFTEVLVPIILSKSPDVNKKKSILNKIQHRSGDRKIVRYGVFPCQDTILPLFFEDIYNDVDFSVEFRCYNDWNDGLEAFQKGEIDVALHNFPTAVAFNTRMKKSSPLFFWPFFSFNGYSLWVKPSALTEYSAKRPFAKIEFDKWPAEEKKKFFLKHKILVEAKTDFEWVLHKFLVGLGLNESEMSEFICKCVCPCNTNTAKGKFVRDKKIAAYITNPIHTFDLKQPRYHNHLKLLYHGNKLTTHKNFNGLICSVDYYKANESIIHRLIERWFIHTEKLMKKISHNPNPLDSERQQEVSITIPGLLAFLNKQTKSLIKEEHLQFIYDPAYNTFYDDHEAAFRQFYDVDLSKDEIISNYAGIAQTELSDTSQAEQNIKESITAIRDMMLQL